jgi:SAM-dependent methyltransferase
MNQNTGLHNYYARRAGEYEKIYAKPERQEDLIALRALLRELFSGHDVLEVACGTGYWTQVISESAKSVLATDINEEVLEIARRKDFPNTNVVFQPADAFALSGVTSEFTAGFAGFWWSHVPKARIRPLLEVFHSKLRRGALVVFIDNNYVEGSSTPVARRDGDGNTYQKRKLENGVAFEVLKNFPSAGELRAAAKNLAENITVYHFRYYWCLSYTTP